MRASAHTLVIQTAFLGDVVLTTPLLTALAVRHGPIDIVTTPTAALLIETHPAVRQTISYDKRGADRGWDGLRRLARGLRQERYRRAYIPHRSLRSAALALLARIPCRIGFGGSWSFLYTESRRKPAEGHESDRLLALADGAPAAYPPQLRPTPIDVQAVADLLEGAGIGYAAPLIAIAPGSIWGSKRWPYYAELAAELATTCAVVAVFGPTVPEFGFGPLRAGDVSLGIDGLQCRPCSAHGPRACPLGHHRCMRELTVEAVLAAIEETGALRRRR